MAVHNGSVYRKNQPTYSLRTAIVQPKENQNWILQFSKQLHFVGNLMQNHFYLQQDDSKHELPMKKLVAVIRVTLEQTDSDSDDEDDWPLRTANTR